MASEPENKLPGKRFPGGSVWRIFMLVTIDGLCVFSCAWCVLWAYKTAGFGHYELSQYLKLLPFCGVLIICNALFRCYHGSILYPGAGLNKIEEVRRLAGSAAITFLLLLGTLTYAHQAQTYSRFCLFVSVCVICVVLPIVRALLRHFLKWVDLGQTDVLVAGTNRNGIRVAREFQSDSYYGFRVVGFLDEKSLKPGATISNVPVLGTLDDAERVAKQLNVEYLVCCLSVSEFSRRYQTFSQYFKHITFVPAGQIFPISWLTPISIGVFSGFEIRNKLLQPIPRLLKSIVELVLALAAIIVLFPVFLVLAAVIKFTSPGPVFYGSIRLGLGGKKITVWKFRSMYQDADKRLADLFARRPDLKAEWNRTRKLKDDPRVTPVGHFLRKTSLDELPQFWNVLTGSMSLIGPRPIVDEEVRYYGGYYEMRKRVKPGITGLWQISGRSDSDYPSRVRLDAYYIMNWSIWMDYYIFFKTVYTVLMCKGAR